ASSTYQFAVASMCNGKASTWSAQQQFTTAALQSGTRPNIVMILTDDDWFVTPTITRIATEGVNFKIAIPTTSQCAPSRASIYTGKYAHDNKCHANGDDYDHSLPQIQKIMGE